MTTAREGPRRLSAPISIIFYFANATLWLGLLTEYLIPNGYSKLSIILGVVFYLVFGIALAYELFTKTTPSDYISDRKESN